MKNVAHDTFSNYVAMDFRSYRCFHSLLPFSTFHYKLLSQTVTQTVGQTFGKIFGQILGQMFGQMFGPCFNNLSINCGLFVDRRSTNRASNS